MGETGSTGKYITFLMQTTEENKLDWSSKKAWKKRSWNISQRSQLECRKYL